MDREIRAIDLSSMIYGATDSSGVSCILSEENFLPQQFFDGRAPHGLTIRLLRARTARGSIN